MTSNNGILIIGATPQGLQTALTLARLGRKVTLIDRDIEIASPPKGWSDRGKRWNHYLRTQITFHPLIELFTETEVGSIKENGKRVEVELSQRPQETKRCQRFQIFEQTKRQECHHRNEQEYKGS